jgi:transposase
MLSFTGGLKVWVAVDACDMRKGYDGLTSLVNQRFEMQAQSGALYVFANRTRTRLKILYWDGTGLWVMGKRLEKGRFSWPKASDQKQVKLQMRPEALAMLTDGIELRGAKMKPWYERDDEFKK